MGLPFLLGDVPQAVLQPGHLAEPLHLVGFFESFPGVGLDLEEARHLGGVHAEHWAAEAGVLMLTWCAVGPFAGAKRHLPEAEMVSELLPFDVGGFAVFIGGAPGASLIDVAAVMVDHLLRIDGDVPLGRIQVEVTQQLGGDVDRQATVDGLGRENPSKVVRGEPQRRAVDIDDPGPRTPDL